MINYLMSVLVVLGLMITIDPYKSKTYELESGTSKMFCLALAPFCLGVYAGIFLVNFEKKQ